MATKPRPDVRFIVDVTPKTDSSFGRSLQLTVTPVIIEDGKIRNPDSDSEYDGLRVEGHLYDQDDDFHFGFDIVTFDIYRIGPRRAEQVVKVFRRLQKRMEVQDAKWGRAVDSTDILARLADAVGCASDAPFARCLSKAGWSYNDNEYRWMDVDGLRHHLATKISEWKEES